VGHRTAISCLPGATFPGVRVADSDIWRGYRHRLIYAWLVEAGYPDIPLCGTEIGSGTGYEKPMASIAWGEYRKTESKGRVHVIPKTSDSCITTSAIRDSSSMSAAQQFTALLSEFELLFACQQRHSRT